VEAFGGEVEVLGGEVEVLGGVRAAPAAEHAPMAMRATLAAALFGRPFKSFILGPFGVARNSILARRQPAAETPHVAPVDVVGRRYDGNDWS
jgi:hypothetical protein